MPPENLDDRDSRILRALASDARNVTTEEIAEWVDLAPSTVSARINDLEDEGVIDGYAPAIDYQQAGFDPHMVVFGTVAAEEFSIESVLDVAGITRVHRLATDDKNVLIELVAASQDEIEERLDTLNDSGVEVIRTEVLSEMAHQPLGGFGDLSSSSSLNGE
jgi:DNA-binding Lrp family transcriptional regulator